LGILQGQPQLASWLPLVNDLPWRFYRYAHHPEHDPVKQDCVWIKWQGHQ
jgi:hypothetical protein